MLHHFITVGSLLALSDDLALLYRKQFSTEEGKKQLIERIRRNLVKILDRETPPYQCNTQYTYLFKMARAIPRKPFARQIEVGTGGFVKKN